MKMRVTKREVMQNFNKVVKVPYCKLQRELAHLEPFAYTTGVYGWNADIYDLGTGIAIVTGYRPFGNCELTTDILEVLE